MMHLPTNNVVGVAWVKTLAGIPTDRVATTLPRNDDGSVSNGIVAPSGFVTVNALPGEPHRHLPQKQVAYQVTGWAVRSPNSKKVPWGKANNLVETIWHALYEQESFGLLTTPAQFEDVRVMSGYPLSDPTEAEPDETGTAAFTMEFILVWVRRNS